MYNETSAMSGYNVKESFEDLINCIILKFSNFLKKFENDKKSIREYV